MIVTPKTDTYDLFASEVHPKLVTRLNYGEAMQWADEHPVAWDIVMGTRSKPFGKNSSTYMGYQRGDAPDSVIQRVHAFKAYVDEGHGQGHDSVFYINSWRARFTLKHYKDKGFRGGLFKQWDGQYDRGCLELDYTPKTLKEVIDHFVAWCEAGPCRFETKEVRVDGKTVRKASP